MGRGKKGMEKAEDARTYKLNKRRGELSCSICLPHQGENSKRKPKFGKGKPKYKNKRS